MRGLLVRPGDLPIEQEFQSFSSMLSALGATEKSFETALFNDAKPPYEGIGIVMKDQDRRGKRNALGVKGAFVVIGMERLDPDTPANPHSFESLTDEQMTVVRKGLVRAAMFQR